MTGVQTCALPIYIKDTPLHYAVRYKSKEIVELLLKNNANINSKNANGTTPLHVAAYYNSKDIAEILIDKGANINAADKNGKKPIYYAEENIIKKLFEFHGSKE